MKIKSSIFGLFLSLSTFAQVPSYYQSVDISLNGNLLKEQLSDLIQSTHINELIYTPGVWNTLKQADLDPTAPTKVLLLYGWNDSDTNIYNDRTRDKNASCHTSDCNNKWVREHVFPRSKGNPNLGFEGAGSDAHHLRAIDYERNSLRSNFKFTNNISSSNPFSKIVAQGSQTYFFPGDEWKGDVARMVMYMYVRYEAQCQPIQVAAGSTSYSPLGDMPNLLLQWNVEDPISIHEINRNEAIYNVQGNRNPFIDNPFLATKIWGGPLAENKWTLLSNNDSEFANIKIYPNPTQDYFYIKGIKNVEHVEVKLIDINGRIVIQDKLKDVYDISHLSSGTYFILVFNEYQSQSLKLIKK